MTGESERKPGDAARSNDGWTFRLSDQAAEQAAEQAAKDVQWRGNFMVREMSDLESLTDRELDALISTTVFGRKEPVDQPPRYCKSWEGAGCIIERMCELGFRPDMQPMAGKLVEFGFTRHPRVDGRNRWSFVDESISRAVALAAVKTVREGV